MKHLWSPWRMKYIRNYKKSDSCIFCSELASVDGPENLVVHRGTNAFVILNRFPYTSGHLMVLPFAHVSTMTELNPEIRSEMIELTNKAVLVLSDIYHPEGFNLGMNIGAAAGAGIAEHLHMHIVPRWAGDTNFMTAVADTRVLPEDLFESYQQIQQSWISAE